jgi:hypothetical protein
MMKSHTKSVRRSLRFESLERRAMLSSNPFLGVGPSLNSLNNFEGPAAYGESIARNNNVFIFTPVQASNQGPANTTGSLSGRFLNSGVLVSDAANQVNVLNTDIALVSGSLNAAELFGIRQDLQALSAGLSGAASGSYNGPILLPINILAGVNAGTSAQVGEIVQAIEGTLANVANDIQSVEGGASNPSADVSGTVGGLNNAFQSVLHNVNTVIGGSLINGFGNFQGGNVIGLGNPLQSGGPLQNGLSSFLNSQSGNSLVGLNGRTSATVPVTSPLVFPQSPLGSVASAGAQLNLNPFGAVL